MKFTGKAFAASAGLSALFLAVYPTCNWITSHRTHVGSYYFAWEKHMPFVPAIILPYMSIDLFFVIAPFLATSARELRTLALRITMAILTAAVCFLLIPLKFAFERPHVDGPLGLIFNNFRSMDLPFNQCPSLHVALWAILIDIYLRHTRGILRVIIGIWFSLILLSTVLTYQHHIIDVLGGFVLGALCFYLIPTRSTVPLARGACTHAHLELIEQRCAGVPAPRAGGTVLRNARAAGYYTAGAAIFFALGFAWNYLLFWPAVSLAITAMGYSAFGASIFRKHDCVIPLSTWVLLWPVLIGQRLSLIYYSRQCRPCDRLTDHLWIGRRLSNTEAIDARKHGVTAVLDLTSEMSEAKPFREQSYLNLSILDLTAPHPAQINQAIEFIEKNNGIVYLHCKAGYSRTAVIAGAYLLATGRANTVDDAVAMLRAVRPSIIIRPEAMQALQNYHATAATSGAVPHPLSTT